VDFCGPQTQQSHENKGGRMEAEVKAPHSNNVIERKFNIKAKPVRWLGFYLDPRFNRQAHVDHRLALGHHRIKTLARIMGAN
jgi:hypothetical protein